MMGNVDHGSSAVSNQAVGTRGPVVQAGTVHGGVHVHPDTAQRPHVPRQLPATSRYFVGRSDALAALTALAETPAGRGNRVCVVEGAPGVGKTCLVTRWARDVVERLSPDGQIYLDLHGFTPGQPAVSRDRATLALLSALRVPPGEVPPDSDERM